MSDRGRQLISAASTVTRRTPERRVRALRKMLARQSTLRRRAPVELATAEFYLALGTVPRSLWDD